MLAHRVIPTILNVNGRIVKGKGFAANRIVGHTAQAVRIHQQREVDEVCLLDITATREGRGPNLQLVSELAGHCFSPLSVGGGVRTVDDVRDLLRSGADKIVVGTAALQNPKGVREMSDHAGAQAIVVSLDVKGGRVMCAGEALPGDPDCWAAAMQSRGAGEILLQSIDRDGTMQGYDLDLIREVSRAVSIPVVASGGCGKPEHALEAIRAGADAVATGAMLLFSDYTPRQVARHLKDNGVEARV